MSYETERTAIETFFTANWSATPIYYARHQMTPVANSVRLQIDPVTVVQGSIGLVANRIDYFGLVKVAVFVDGGAGEAAYRSYLQSIEDVFFEKVITSAGVVVSSPGDAFIHFSPKNQHPYLSTVIQDPPFTIATMHIPFVRYQTK